jgi:hypothetical protein
MIDLNTVGLLLGLFLTVGGLALTALQGRSANRQAKDLSKMATDLSNVTKQLSTMATDLSSVTKQLTTVGEQLAVVGDQLSIVGQRLSTRFLGEAPDYYPELKAVIDRAKNELFVACTLPAVGFFNYYEAWLPVKGSLEMATVRTKVKCVFGEPEAWRGLLSEQFKEAASDWKSWLATDNNAVKLEKFSQRFGGTASIDSSDALFNTMELALKETLTSTYHDAEVVKTPARLRMYAWVADSKEAVFVIPAIAPKFVAYAFWTRDASIISSLLSNHDEHLEMNRRSKPQSAAALTPATH